MTKHDPYRDTDDHARAVDDIIGPERKRQLLERARDLYVLGLGTSVEHATQLAEGQWPSAFMYVAVGQVWRRRGPIQTGDIGYWSGAGTEEVTIAAVDRNTHMADIGGGRQVEYTFYLPHRYELASWPAEFPAIVESPQPPGVPIAETATEPEDDEDDDADPHHLYVCVQREGAYAEARAARESGDKDAHTPLLRMSAPGYTSTPGKCGNCHVVTLDLVAYLRMHLDDYRAGWANWAELWSPKDAWMAFNEIGRPYESDTVVGAYLGSWMHDRLRADVVNEHGGRMADYFTSFTWSGHYADAVLAAFPPADPRIELHPDHDLMQCPGQLSIFDELGDVAA